MHPSRVISLAPCTVAATRRITGSLIGTMGIVTLLPFVQLDGLWKCIYDTFPGAAAAFNAASFHIELRGLQNVQYGSTGCGVFKRGVQN